MCIFLFYACTATQETAHSTAAAQMAVDSGKGKRVCGVRRANVQCARVARHAAATVRWCGNEQHRPRQQRLRAKLLTRVH